MESLYWRTVVEVVESGSFSRAAEVLCISQSAVSRRIRFMEEQYGCSLLDRTSPSLQPTPAGRVVLEKARHILSLETELVRGLERLKSKRSFSFCCTSAFGIAYLPRVFHSFMLGNVELVDVKFVFDTPARIVQGLQGGLYDLSVIEHCESFDLGGFSAVPLPRDQVVFVSSREVGLPSGEVELGALLEQPLLTRREGSCSRTLLDANLARVGRRLADFRNVAVMDDLHVTLEAIRRGGAVSFLSESIVRQELETGSLTSHYVAGFQHWRHRTLVLGDGSEHCPMLSEFRRTIMGVFDDGGHAGAPEASPAV